MLKRIKNFWLGEAEFRPHKDLVDGKMVTTGFYLNTGIFNRGIIYGTIGLDGVDQMLKAIINNKKFLMGIRVEQGGGWYNSGNLTPRMRRQILKGWANPETLTEEINRKRMEQAQ